MEVTFEGGEATQHRIDLYTGAESLSGLGRTASLVAHYVATGEVRFRAPYSSQLQYYISGTQDGSLKILISEVSRIKSEANAAAAKLRSSKLLKRVMDRATGKAEFTSLEVGDHSIPAGDIDALAEAATPGLKRAHRWIDSRKKSITIGAEGAVPTLFDHNSKEYLETEEFSASEDVQDVSVGALNVNSRNGRVYFHDIGKTISFWVPKNATPQTIPTLSRYLTQYAERSGATVNIRFRRVTFVDGRLKRIIISDCYSIAGKA